MPSPRETELLELLAANGIPAEDLDTYLNWVTGMVEREAIATAAAMVALDASGQLAYAQAYAQITGTIDTGTIALARQARTMAVNLTNAQVDKVAKEVAQGLAEGLHSTAVARRLKSIEALDSRSAATYFKKLKEFELSDRTDAQIKRAADREYERLLNKRRRLIANTEMRNAMSEGQIQEAKKGGAIGKYWIATGDDRVSDGCNSNQAAGIIKVEEQFPSGHMRTPRFPGCRCSIGYVYDEIGKEVAEADIADALKAA